ncbi:MAG: hypothetical protein LWX07_07995 [Bacteroidetes bacterium]|nr:hypothetical protein [Bacteroidota bacterium]
MNYFRGVLFALSIIFVFSATDSFPQNFYLNIDPHDYLISPSQDYYSLNFLSVVNAGKGNTGVASKGDVTSALINPASLTLTKKYQTVISYGIKTSSDYTITDNLSQVHPSFSAGAAFKLFDGLNAGILYSNRRNMSYTVNSGTLRIEQVFNEQVFSIPVSVEYDILKAGIGLNFRLMHGSLNGIYSTVNFPDGTNTYGKTDKILFTPDFGIILSPYQYVSIGLMLSPAGEFENYWEYDTLFPNHTSTSRFPLRITAGTELRFPREGFKISFDYTFENMSDLIGYENRSNVNIGAEYEPSQNVTVRSGFFTMNTQSNRKHLYPQSDNQYFLTVGGSYLYKGIKFNLALLSSSLVMKSDISHTIINFGAAYEF